MVTSTGLPPHTARDSCAPAEGFGPRRNTSRRRPDTRVLWHASVGARGQSRSGRHTQGAPHGARV